MICGYSKSGKDTLCKQLMEEENTIPFNWEVIARNPENLSLHATTFYRMAFADSLKKHVGLILNIGSVSEVDKVKDGFFTGNLDEIDKNVHNIFQNAKNYELAKTFKNKETVTVRDILIHVAEHVRKHDPEFWVESAIKTYTKHCKTVNNENDDEIVIVTDWRYENEYDYLFQNPLFDKIVTARVYSPNIDPVQIPGEIGLNKFKTDIIFVRDVDNIKTFKFPKYLSHYNNYECYIKMTKPTDNDFENDMEVASPNRTVNNILTLVNKFGNIIFISAIENHENLGTLNKEKVEELYHDHGLEHPGDMGLDLYCPEEVVIPGKALGFRLPLGIVVAFFGDNGSESFTLNLRSSTGFRTPLRLSNMVGQIDAGYRGQLMALFDNLSEEDYVVEAGKRLVQIVGKYVPIKKMILLKNEKVPDYREFLKTENIKIKNTKTKNTKIRGAGGFGSTSK